MTYCLALRLDDGLVFLSDTRTNAGVDNISTYRKLHVIQPSSDRAFVIQSVDAKGGIKVAEVKEDGKKEEPKSKDKEEEVAASEPRYLVAGSAAAAGIAFAGLWAVRRRKVV